jgi:CRISPR-associated endonuclease/helicase Cas3
MHITLVSQCEKKALKRSRALIDRYAVRISDRSWITPITTEALDDLRMALRQTATRQTAVACYINQGKNSMKLAWTVGRSDFFGEHGALAVGTRQRHRTEPPLWLRVAALVAKAAGLVHDFGKGSIHFQEKLKSTSIIKDKTRHEWISMKLYQAMRSLNQFSWDAAWTYVRESPDRHAMPFMNGKEFYPIHSAFDAIDFSVLTHHRLLAPSANKKSACGDRPEEIEHTHREGGAGDELDIFTEAAPLTAKILDILAKTTERIAQIHLDRPSDPLFFRGITLIARAALILADHEVSALTTSCKNQKNNSDLYANTCRINEKSQLNQKLDWHLENVSQRAQEIIHYFDNHELPTLCPQTRANIDADSGQGRYQWQDKAASHLRGLQEQNQHPTLIFNLAGTGAGKTRMNVRALAALRGEDEPLRIAAGFNLRTLTLQTHRAFKTQLGMSDDEVACVIGDRFARAMYEDNSNTDENNINILEYDSVGQPVDYPQWLQTMAKGDPGLLNLIGAPVLVSTMDYLVNAGDPTKQGHHAHALLRIASSDLILDEVDSYDPIALVAVVRIVQMAGLFGRHVVASSATLSEPVAEAIFKAYQSGVAMYAALRLADISPRLSFIDHQLYPSSFITHSSGEFIEKYGERLNELVMHTQQLPAYRACNYQRMNVPTNREDAFNVLAESVQTASMELHANQSWAYGTTGKHVSIGLIRVASVKTCVELASSLIQTMPNAHVTAYHAVDLRLRRWRKEESLDRLLYRNPDDGSDGNSALLNDTDIQDRVARTLGNDVMFIVVATPVEEVGRDHDFDWAIIEPSSVQSIVQLAGRVNRHRLVHVSKPNVSILQLNRRALQGEERAFHRPGNEVGDALYNSHDAIKLLGDELKQIDASLRFGDTHGKCIFAVLDDKSIQQRMNQPMGTVLGESNRPLTWTTQCHYELYPLRNNSERRRFRFSKSKTDKIVVEEFFAHMANKKTPQWRETDCVSLTSKTMKESYWLAPTIEDLISEQKNYIHDSHHLMEFEVVDVERVSFHAFFGGY